METPAYQGGRGGRGVTVRYVIELLLCAISRVQLFLLLIASFVFFKGDGAATVCRVYPGEYAYQGSRGCRHAVLHQGTGWCLPKDNFSPGLVFLVIAFFGLTMLFVFSLPS